MEPAPPADAPRPLFPPDSLDPAWPDSLDPAWPRRRFSWRDFLIGVAAGIVLAIVGSTLLVAGLVALASRAAGNASGIPEAALPAPEFPPHGQMAAYGQADMAWTFQRMEGGTASLSDYRGKVVFLNFWATWCGPCVAEMPSIQKLHDSLGRDDVAFLLVSDEEAPKIERFLQGRSLTLPVFRTRGTVPSLFRTSAIPATFIIDGSGMVVLRRIGAARWDSEPSVTFLKTVLRIGADR